MMNSLPYQPSSIKSDKLSRDEVLELGVLNGWRFSLALGCDIFVLAGAIALSEYFFFNPFVYVLSVILIGSRLHAMGILMHDCVHYRAFKARKLNMFVGVLLGWSVLTSAENYRNNHLTHHRHLNTEHDPDWTRKLSQQDFHFPKRRREIVRLALYQLSGIGVIQLFFSLRKGSAKGNVSATTRLFRTGSYIFVLALCLYTGTLDKLALYWLVPMLTVFPLVFYIRSVAEHHGNLAYNHLYTNSRTTIPNAWESFLFLPHNVGYHLEHHLYPHVPFYRLKALHRLLMQRRHYAENAHVTRGVCTGLLGEWIGLARGPSVLEFHSRQKMALVEQAG